MPAWLSLILWNIVLPDLIAWLRKEGYINAAEALAAKGAERLLVDVKSLKTASGEKDFPDSPPQEKTTNNLG